MSQPGLGRNPHYDPRNERFRIRALVAAPPPSINSRYWFADGWWGDQGATSQCTAYSLLHYMEDGPVTHRTPATPMESPAMVYAAIQAVDFAEGRNYGYDGGATMLAQSKAALGRKWIGEYRWGYTLDELVNCVLTTGPVCVGTNWYTGMFEPDGSDRVKISGSIAGGHAFVINGVNRSSAMFRLKNSWGREWGRRGHAYISFADMARLILEDGEVVLARELP